MGLREKVALFIILLILVQLMHGECGARIKKVVKPRRSKVRKHGKIIQTSVKKDNDVVRRFNFPEVEYSLPMSQPSSLFSKQNLDINCGQVSHPLPSVSKPDMDLLNKSKNRKFKINRKNTKADATSTKISQIPSYPEETLPDPLTKNCKVLFPSVDYPLDASDLWTPYYWNHISPPQTELKFNTKDLSMDKKGKGKTFELPKGSKNVANTEKTNKDKEELENTDSKNDTCCIVVTETNKNDTNNICLTNTGKLRFDEMMKNLVTTPPISIETPAYDKEPTVSPLTTSPPIASANENVNFGKDTKNSPDTGKEENDEMADEMGYTLMYPEVSNFLSTSTPAPLLVDDIDKWMYPELDNHTLNTYSDEVDQCYILIH